MKVKDALSKLNPFNYRFSNEKRSSSYSTITGFPWLQYVGTNSSGVNLAGKSAMQIAAVYICVAIRRDAVGMLGFNTFREDANGKKLIDKKHESYRVLHTRPNPWQTATQFWGLVVQLVDLDGEAFGLITRKNGKLKRIDLVDKSDVEVLETPEGDPIYKYKSQVVDYANMLHFKDYTFDGKRGVSKVGQHRETIGSLKKLNEYGNRNINAVPPMYLTTPNAAPMRREGQESTKETFVSQAQEYFSEGKIPILHNGLKFETVGLKPADAGYLEQINAKKEDIYGIFRVPPAIAGAYKTGVTFNNLEQQNLQFLIYGLSPLLKNIEEEINEKVYLNEDVIRYGRFNVAALLRTDLKTQGEWFSIMFKLGCYTQNDILQLQDMNTFEGGDRRYVEGNNMVPIDMIDEMIKSKSQQGKLSEDVKKRLKEQFNGKSAEIIQFFES
jgi:HK97 family phage portal protein